MDPKPRKFIVTFRDQEDADGMLRSDFIGLGKAHSGKDLKVVVLHPFPHVSDADLKETLEELRSVGALTYVEDRR
jgi:hypothetical protein